MAASNKAAVDDFFRRYLVPSADDASDKRDTSSPDGGGKIAAEGPVQQDIEKLSSHLQRIGYYGPLPMALLQARDGLEDGSDGTRMYDVIQFLLKKLTKKKGVEDSLSSMPDIDVDLSSKCERLQADLDHLMNVRQSLLSEVKVSRQENASLSSRMVVMEENFAAQSSSWAKERELLQKQISGLKQRDVQFQHDVRRLERESEQLRTKLRQLLTTKEKIAKVGISVVGVVDSGVVTQATAVGQLETYKSMVARYDEQQRSLLHENDQLRHMLSAVTEELRQWGEIAEIADAQKATIPLQPPEDDSNTEPEVFTGDVKALFERLKEKAQAGIAAKTHIGEMKKILKDQDDLLRLALGVSPHIADKLKERASSPSISLQTDSSTSSVDTSN